MTTFSQRMGFKPIKNVLQIDSMDDDLRNKLWNALSKNYWKRTPSGGYLPSDTELHNLFISLWDSFFSLPVDTLNEVWEVALKEIRFYYFSCKWNEVYDLIEFFPQYYINKRDLSCNARFMSNCNIILEQEMSGYRFVNGLITLITTPTEIETVENALAASPNPVKEHLKRSLELLSDRNSPDFRNSIKESISAVEALCKRITGDSNATLGKALKQIEDAGHVDIHGAVNKAFQQLYGYTSDASGIRHALLNEKDLAFEDALFMLVSCSAFVNYLLSKSQKAGLKL